MIDRRMIDHVIELLPIARRRVAAASVAAVAVFALAACGDSSDDDADGDTASTSDAARDDTMTGDAADGTTTGDDPADDATGDANGDGTGVGTTKPEVRIPDDTPTELMVDDLIAGTGEPAEAGDTVTMHYVGVLSEDGTEFDSSWEREPLGIEVGRGQVIPGFDEGLLGVQEGTRRQIDIPSELAYGDQGAGGVIPPGAAISFVIDVLAIDRPTLPPQADPADCPDGSGEQRREFDAYPPFCIDVDATYTAEITTNFGDITVELSPDRAPLTVNNFVVLARYGYFDDTECHRAIPDFVVQCGDPTATGTGGPGYRFEDELPAAGEYRIGSLAMANAGPDTNGSQFFIITGPSGAALPPQYSLFGEVTEGLDTTVADLDAVANPENNGVPPLEPILIESVRIIES